MTQAEPVEQAGFQYVRTLGGCQCPIHRDGEPVTAPLGLRFAERVHIESIPQRVTAAIYDTHHLYMDDVPRTNIVHHGLCYQDQLVGAITWRHLLIRMLRYDDTRYHGDEIVETAASASASTFRISRRLHSPARWSSSSAGTPIGAEFDSW